MSIGYYRRLQRDFQSAGLLAPSEDRSGVPITSYTELGALLLTSVHIGNQPELAALDDFDSFDARTALGARAIELNRQQVRFRESDLHHCDYAEGRLLINLGLERTVSRDTPAPVLLTDSGRAVAIIKRFGSPSCYALEDNPDFGLVKGTLGTPGLPAAMTSWINLGADSDKVQKLDIEAMQPTTPIRFTAFAVPAEERQGLDSRNYIDELILQTSHEQIVETVSALQQKASYLEL